MGTSLETNNWQASQQTKEMGFGKGASAGEISSWPSISIYGGVDHVLDVCGQACEYVDAPKTLTGLTCLFEERCRMHYVKKEK